MNQWSFVKFWNVNPLRKRKAALLEAFWRRFSLVGVFH